jgi:alkylation response protein AidB-like acyl-CoA dehydrogenase
VALAGVQVGGAQRCRDLGGAYAKQRVEFGRPIGSFRRSSTGWRR